MGVGRLHGPQRTAGPSPWAAGATNFAIGVVAARVIEAVTRNERRVLPVTSFVSDYQGIKDVAMSVPCVVGSGGVAAHLEVPMDEAEHAALDFSAQTIREAAALAGL